VLRRPVESAQYTSVRFTEHLALAEIRPSIGTVGDAYDNALMETINGLYKAECIRTTVFHDGPYKTIADVEYATAGWVDWYNVRRLHGSLGSVPPLEFEQAHYAASTESRNPYKSGREPGRFTLDEFPVAFQQIELDPHRRCEVLPTLTT
jgi:hypothetical protein